MDKGLARENGIEAYIARTASMEAADAAAIPTADNNSNKIITAREGSKTPKACSSNTVGGLVHDNGNGTLKDSNNARSSNTVGELVHDNGNGTPKDSNNNNHNGTPKACSSNTVGGLVHDKEIEAARAASMETSTTSTPPAAITSKEGSSDADINACAREGSKARGSNKAAATGTCAHAATNTEKYPLLLGGPKLILLIITMILIHLREPIHETVLMFTWKRQLQPSKLPILGPVLLLL